MSKGFRLGYRPGLDGLRAVAIVAVVVFHFSQGDGALGTRGGFLGVELFFVLSGFLITSLLWQEIDEHGRISARRFYARRALRLLPAFGLMVVTYVVWSLCFGPDGKRTGIVHDALAAVFYVANWRRAFSADPVERGLGHTWSLSVEEQFYLVWPLLMTALYAVGRRRAVLLAAGAGAVAVCAYRAYAWHHGTSLQRLWYGTDAHSDSLLIGCVLATALARGLPRWCDRVASLLLLPSLAFMLVSLTAYVSDNEVLSGGFTAFGIASAILIYNVIARRSFARVLEHPVAQWIGKRSYGIYLWHLPLFFIVTFYLRSGAATVILALSLSVVVPALSYRYVEQPFLRAKRRLAPRPSAPQAEGTPEPQLTAT